MRIDGNRPGSQELLSQAEAVKGQQKEKQTKEHVSIQASQLNLMQDGILERRKKAMADAMDIIGKQFGVDGKIDDDLNQRRERIAESKEKASTALKERQALSEEQEKLREQYGVDMDSEEQSDLELRIKMREAMKPGSRLELSEEEWERLQKMGPETEYQKAALEIEASKDVWNTEIKEAHKVIATETQVIRATKQELLKHHGMVDAARIAEDSLEAASNEILGMLRQEGMEHVQEEIDEKVEEAQEKKEEKEEQGAVREEKKAQQEEMNQNLKNLPDIQRVQDEVDQQIQEIRMRQKLLEEDLKGIQVDSNI